MILIDQLGDTERDLKLNILETHLERERKCVRRERETILNVQERPKKVCMCICMYVSVLPEAQQRREGLTSYYKTTNYGSPQPEIFSGGTSSTEPKHTGKHSQPQIHHNKFSRKHPGLHQKLCISLKKHKPLLSHLLLPLYLSSANRLTVLTLSLAFGSKATTSSHTNNRTDKRTS